jgi:phage tail-like protein
VNANAIAAYLPAVFREAIANDPTLQSLLEVMAGLQDPVETRLADLRAIFNPLVTDERFTLMLARWVDLVWLYANDDDDVGSMLAAGTDSSIPPGRLRALIRASHVLAAERGTAKGLVRFLEIATGVKGFFIEDAAAGGAPFHFFVHVPRAAAAQAALVARIVNAEKPAHATWESIASAA